MKQEAPSVQPFPLEQTFFGFKPEDRPGLHENIFNMLWHGEGRWTWDEIYEMPVFLRRFYVKQLNKILETRQQQQQDQIEAAQRRNSAAKKPLPQKKR